MHLAYGWVVATPATSDSSTTLGHKKKLTPALVLHVSVAEVRRKLLKLYSYSMSEAHFPMNELSDFCSQKTATNTPLS